MNDLLQVFKALSDETRLRILKLLEHGELCVCDIVASLDIIQPKISFHLGVLKEWIHYRLDESDMFRRVLLLFVNEKIEGSRILADQQNLKDFLRTKPAGITCLPSSKSRACCGK
jgi:ArsR family transcriptional regulator